MGLCKKATEVARKPPEQFIKEKSMFKDKFKDIVREDIIALELIMNWD